MSYIIDGIPDSKVNNMLLYKTTTVCKFKEEVKVYLKIKGEESESHKSNANGNYQCQTQRNTKERRRCQNCGSFSDSNTGCPDREKGSKCFDVMNFGTSAKTVE